MERERPAAPVAREQSSEPVETDRLAVLLGHARAASGAERASFAARINGLLRAMRTPGNEALEADVVLAGLEQKLFHDLVDRQGADCRAEAVETLMATGFPHALKVSPEDLAYARAPTAQKPARVREDDDAEAAHEDVGLMPATLAIAALAQLAGALIAMSTGGAAVGSGIGAAVLGFAAWMAGNRRGNDDRFGSILLAVIGCAIGVICAFSAHTMLLAGGAGILGLYLLVVLQLNKHRWK